MTTLPIAAYLPGYYYLTAVAKTNSVKQPITTKIDDANQTWDDQNMFSNYTHSETNSEVMKSITRHIAILIAAIAAGTGLATGQMLKLNAPLTLGVGYAHMRYHKYKLGGAYRHRPIGGWRSSKWIGPTRFSISFGYVLDCGCRK